MDHVVAALGEESPVSVVTASPGLVHTDMTEKMWDDTDDLDWVSTEPIERFVRRFAAGELDHLHGQFVRAATDDY